MCIATPRGRPDETPRITPGGLLWATFIVLAAGIVWLGARFRPHRPA